MYVFFQGWIQQTNRRGFSARYWQVHAITQHTKHNPKEREKREREKRDSEREKRERERERERERDFLRFDWRPIEVRHVGMYQHFFFKTKSERGDRTCAGWHSAMGVLRVPSQELRSCSGVQTCRYYIYIFFFKFFFSICFMNFMIMN